MRYKTRFPNKYINQFIAKLTSTCDPIFKLLRKNEPHEWKDMCQKAFELIKEYLLHPYLDTPDARKTIALLSLYHRICGSKYACTRRQ